MEPSIFSPSEAAPPSDAERLLLDTLATMGRTVATQVSLAVRAFEQRDQADARAVVVKDGYVNNLNSQLQELAPHVGQRGNPPLARCVWSMASHLEHIGDYAVNVARQTIFRQDAPPPAGTHRLRAYQGRVVRGTAYAIGALRQQSLEVAFATCRLEEEIDALYAQDIARIAREMERGGKQARLALTWAFVVKNLERMGDMLLNLGEAVLSMICGEKMKLEHLRSVEHLLPRAQLRIKGVWGGTSGAFVGVVERDGGAFVYKGGPREKIVREYENLRRWEAIGDDVTPAVVQAPGQGDPVSLLLERIVGPTLEDVVFSQDVDLSEPLQILFRTLEPLWSATHERRPAPTDFVSQIRSRLTALFGIHPFLADIRGAHLRVGPLDFPALETLLERAAERQESLPSPATVFLHGDLNLSNLVLECPAIGGGGAGASGGGVPGRRIRMVDVYRSHRGDLTQDISVLMVSCLRHPLSTGPPAERARWFYEAIRARATAYAERHGDDRFGERLKLGLARSYITSGRVLGDRRLALRLFLKGIWYLEDFACLRSEW